MAHSIGEVEAFVGISSALLINVGTLTDGWVRRGAGLLDAGRLLDAGSPHIQRRACRARCAARGPASQPCSARP